VKWIPQFRNIRTKPIIVEAVLAITHVIALAGVFVLASLQLILYSPDGGLDKAGIGAADGAWRLVMEYSAGESEDGCLLVSFNRRLKLEFHGSRITSDAGIVAHREMDDAVGLAGLAGAVLSECRRGRNTFADRAFSPSGVRPPRRLRGCQRDADRLAHDPAMRAVVGGLDHRAVSTSQMGSCYTAWVTGKANLAARTDLSGAWIDRVHARKPVGTSSCST
jgi:hypothetical protein